MIRWRVAPNSPSAVAKKKTKNSLVEWAQAESTFACLESPHLNLRPNSSKEIEMDQVDVEAL